MYTDEELQKMYKAAMEKQDSVMAAAVLAVATAHEKGNDDDLMKLLLMFTNFHLHSPEHEGGQHGRSITDLDPDTVVQF